MAERKYSVSEIDSMRNTISSYGWAPNSGAYYPADRAMEIEERLRTYMIAGVEPTELFQELRTVYEEALLRKHEFETRER